jgi:hypothetical protein
MQPMQRMSEGPQIREGNDGSLIIMIDRFAPFTALSTNALTRSHLPLGSTCILIHNGVNSHP